jgi:hypothetical protein
LSGCDSGRRKPGELKHNAILCFEPEDRPVSE